MRQQLQEALTQAKRNGLDDDIVRFYERVADAHEEMGHALQDLGDRAWARHIAVSDDVRNIQSRAKALIDESARLTEQIRRTRDPQAVEKLRERERELLQELAAETGKADALKAGIEQRTPAGDILEPLWNSLDKEVLETDLAGAGRKVLGAVVDVVDSVSIGAAKKASDGVDRIFDGRMQDDDGAQSHYKWLTEYRRKAEKWTRDARSALNKL